MKKSIIPIVCFVLLSLSCIYILWTVARSAYRLFYNDVAMGLAVVAFTLAVIGLFFWPVLAYKRLHDKAIAMPVAVWLPHILIALLLRIYFVKPYLFTGCNYTITPHVDVNCVQRAFMILVVLLILNTIQLVVFTVMYFKLIKKQKEQPALFSFEADSIE